MAVNYNIPLLNTLNEVRAGGNRSFTIGYSISSKTLASVSKGGLLNTKLTEKQFRNDVQSALTLWVNLLNNIYTPNKKVKGSLNCKLVNDTNANNDFNVNISNKDLKKGVLISKSKIVLNSNLDWKSLSFESGVDIFSHIVYGVGKLLGITDSYIVDSIMNPNHLKVNYISYYSLSYDSSGVVLYPDAIVDSSAVKKLKTIYGSMLYTYSIVYGCLNPNADNYNKNATRSDNTCSYTKKSLPTVYKSKLNKY